VIEIRKIRKGEEESAKKLIDSIMRSEFSGALTSYPTDDLDAIQDHYGGLGEAFLVAVDGNRIVGTVAVKREDERTALLRRVFVDPANRKQRIGFQLMKKAIDFCSEVGYQEVIFKTTSEMKAANKLCQDNGFQEKARIPLGPTALIKFTRFLRENTALNR